MSDDKTTPKTPLTDLLSKYEVAHITLSVPGSGDPYLDKLIMTSLRFRISTQLLEAFSASRPELEAAQKVKLAIAGADALILAFSK